MENGCVQQKDDSALSVPYRYEFAQVAELTHQKLSLPRFGRASAGFWDQ